MKPEGVPFFSLGPQSSAVKDDINRAFERVIKRGMFILGDEVTSFEKKYSAFHNVSHTIGTASGFDALYLSLKALGIGKGDEVIVPSNTCMPTWMAVLTTGATLVPAEPGINTYTIDPQAIEDLASSRTRAIVPVHLYGQACDMQKITAIASRKLISIIEDNAQAHGSSFNDQSTGSFGILNAHSFYPTKNLGAFGDGGAITTNNKDLAESIKSLRNYGGINPGIADKQGINSRLDELQAAILSVKLKKLNQWNRERKKIAAFYKKELKNIADLELPVTAAGADHVYHLFVIRTSSRDDLQSYLAKKNIGTKVHYPVPPHLQEAFKSMNFKKRQFPVAEQISNTCLSLPLWPGMTPHQCEQVVDGVRSFFTPG